MKELAILGAVAVGGYLLYSHFMENNQVIAVNSTPTAVPVVNKYAAYLISQSLEAELENYYRNRWGTAGNPSFDGWNYVYNQYTGQSMPFSANSFGVNTTVTYTVDQWASIINNTVNNNGLLPQLSGLGMLAIAGQHHPVLQNTRLPYNLELFNAMTR